MNIEPTYLLGATVVGIGATLVTDLWAVFLKRVFSMPLPSYCLVGRWIRHMPEGTFRHASISAAPQRRSECTVGWIAHYVIGILFALGLVFLASEDWLARPTLLPALAFGIGTVLFPFLVMQPSFGFGIAASRTPHPARARLKSLMTHAVFGIGLYASAVVVSPLLRPHA